ncbi:MAG: hypothetical protein LBD86_04610 [Spirochaetaceae bacterium]|jgi:hypothetical protein|nr:hypothetical protein [Spirochaetaceae bacterium]
MSLHKTEKAAAVAALMIGLLLAAGCENPPGEGGGGDGCEILAYRMYAPDDEENAVEGEVDGEYKTVVITVPVRDPLLSEVAVTISEGAKIALLNDKPDPADGKVYRVTAGNGAAYNDYTVYTVWMAGAELTLTGGPALTGETGQNQINVSVTLNGEDTDEWPDNVSQNIKQAPIVGVTRNMPVELFVLTANDPDCEDYRWYVDGEQLIYYNADGWYMYMDGDKPIYKNSAVPHSSPRGPVVNGLAGINYSVGKHFLFLVAIKNGVPLTYQKEFTVVLDPTE